MVKKIDELSKNEWVVMKVCWKKKQVTARNVYEATLKQKKWEYQTVKTMLDRLIKKGYLQREKFGPVYIYSPVISQKQSVRQAVESFVGMALDNTIIPIVAHFVDRQKLTQDEVKSLKKLIENYEELSSDE
ncbi:BlaI/MecI/CopY family transcriptional regulator [Candidatus Uabimicrobium sp. HlEnr_7]|uniref:BlaI/MecI/CopY family transcriptional regulator n=1 Tax=Candidatus Uabimicrobium helgolandensis TaxID=3095367 RepID=UPI003556B6DF